MTRPDDMPPDPDLDDLPPEIARHRGPLFVGWIEPDADKVYVQRTISPLEIAVTLADERRQAEAED